MKTQHIFLSAALISASFLTSSCDDDHAHEATITIHGPSGTYHSGDTVTIDVSFAHDHDLHDMSITVTRKLDGVKVYEQSRHGHDKTYRWVDALVVMTADHSDFELTATVVDHGGNVSTKTATFHVHPHEGGQQHPEIIIHGPTGMFQSGNTVQVHVSFNHPGHHLHDVHVRITRQHDSAVVLDVEEHVHDASFTYDQPLVVMTTAHSDFLIEALTKNHDGQVTASVNATFHVHPH